jgi:hypothetical protein
MSKQTGYSAEGNSRIELSGLWLSATQITQYQDVPAYEAEGDDVCYSECHDDEHEDVEYPAVATNLDVLYEAIVEAEQR